MENPKLILLINMATLYGRSMTGGAYDLMLDALDDIPAKDLEIAIKHCMRSGGNRMPVVSELLEAAVKHGNPYAGVGTVIRMNQSEGQKFMDDFMRSEDEFIESKNAENERQRMEVQGG